MTSVSYRGTAPALTDVIAGHIPTTFVPISEAFAQAHQSERPHARGVERQALAAPAGRAVDRGDLSGLQRGVLDRNAGAGRNAEADRRQARRRDGRAPPRTRSSSSSSQDNGIEPAAEGPEKFAALIAAEIPNWAKAVEIAGVKVQQ